jgi:ABC-2 type transport system ATP-binding protein
VVEVGVDAVIEVAGLRKEYRRMRRPRTVAVDGLDLSVPSGGVYGFLGPNGSGKTTTIRCLLSLATPSTGSCRLLGAETPRALATVIDRVGAIVETPTLFPNFSGHRNLSLLAGLSAIPSSRIDDVLGRVGLGDRAGDRVKTYSLGMRQRLGLAAALLKDPELLILDEPANGLDPAGIVEIRQLLRQLADEGRTVFVSSHQLAEIEQTCDRVAILSRGRLVTDGPVAEVLARSATASVVIKVDPAHVAPATSILTAAGFAARAEGGTVVVDAPADAGATLNHALGSQGIWAFELRPRQVTLEDVFLQLTGEPSTMGAPPPPPGPTTPPPSSTAPPPPPPTAPTEGDPS